MRSSYLEATTEEAGTADIVSAQTILQVHRAGAVIIATITREVRGGRKRMGLGAFRDGTHEGKRRLP